MLGSECRELLRELSRIALPGGGSPPWHPWKRRISPSLQVGHSHCGSIRRHLTGG